MDRFDLRLWKGFENAGGEGTKPALVDQVSIDSRRIHSQLSLFVALEGKQLDGHRFLAQAAQAGARFALVRKDRSQIPPIHGMVMLKVDSPLRALQEIAQTYRKGLPGTFIAVGGSYGKTMLKDLLAELLAPIKRTAASPESFNSQIGVPLSLLRVTGSDEIAIIEAGISRSGEMDILADLIQPDHVIVTTIGRKHEISLGSEENTKKEIFKLKGKQWNLSPFGSKGEKNSYCWKEEQEELPHARPIGKDYEIRFPGGTTYRKEIPGGHSYFLDLINPAIKAAWLLGCSEAIVKDTLGRYRPEPFRTEIWPSPRGAIFINEPYCSDPQSVDLALKHFEKAHPEGKRIFLFGGFKGEVSPHEYRRVDEAIAQSKADKLCYSNFEEAAGKLKNELGPFDTVIIKGKEKVPFDTLTEAFHGSVFSSQYLINLAAVETNLDRIRLKLSRNTRVMAMVKAQGYGTDALQMAKYLGSKGVEILGVSYVDEGIALKRAGIRQSIFTLNAAPFEASKTVEWGLEVGVSERSIIKALAEEGRKQDKIVPVHLHVDTGMSRLGCRPEAAPELALEILKHPALKLEGLFTHFAGSDHAKEDPFTARQIVLFDRVILSLEEKGIEIPWKHASNSAGVLRFDLPQYNMVRIGLSLLGLMPGKETIEAHGLKLAVSLSTRITGINTCQKGETVSYGRNYTMMHLEGRIAVLPIGYYDGLHRSYSGKGHAIIHGKKVPYVGSICMDYMMVDISEIPEAKIGDPVLIFGEDEYGNYISPEELASQSGSIVYELSACLGPRIQRVFIYEENQKSC